MIDNREHSEKKDLLNAELTKGEESGLIKDFDKNVFMRNLRNKYSTNPS